MKLKDVLIGTTLIIVGVIFSLQSFGIVTNFWGYFWPMFLIVPGVIFHLAFFLSGAKKHLAGLLVPGGILLVIGLLFAFETMTSWQFSEDTWPIYLFAVALGLFELYVFGGRESGLLIPVFILAGIGTIFLLNGLLSYPIFKFWPLILIAVGLYIILGRSRSKSGLTKQ
ncbi:LiaI-LiaF-like domain-containing protein [Bacillus sp. DJP31]|uniref:LiaI-LiaF-like domain-containing protein n=1 Tax=Bacillus sp. DJP31 TaxID=3409789 RepID=UPI003BB79CE9